MRNINFFGATGGAGTTTIAAACGIVLGRPIVAIRPYDVQMHLGRPAGSPIPTESGSIPVLSGDEPHPEGRHVVRDLGTVHDLAEVGPVDGDTYAVVRGPSHLGLQNLVGVDFAGIVLVAEEGRALRESDVEQVVGRPIVATVAVDRAIARAADTGLLAFRIPKTLTRLAHVLDVKVGA